jgi:hypothetical protein
MTNIFVQWRMMTICRRNVEVEEEEEKELMLSVKYSTSV